MDLLENDEINNSDDGGAVLSEECSNPREIVIDNPNSCGSEKYKVDGSSTNDLHSLEEFKESESTANVCIEAQEDDEEMITVDEVVGFSDTESMEDIIPRRDIELSSDEEKEDDDVDVALVCLKRPLPVEIECFDILDSDEEFPVCLAINDKEQYLNVEEKRGYVKEYIETEGAGILFSETYGLVLFHLSNVWIDGEQLSPVSTREVLQIGVSVSFYDQTFEGENYSTLSNDNVLHQAIVAWTGERPNHLLKKIGNLSQSQITNLENQRNNFVFYLKGDVFLRCALVRVKGEVIGYTSDKIGIIECTLENRERVKVLFNTEDVRIFRRPLEMYERTYCTPGTKLLPVGLSVSVDAREINIPGARSIAYQATCVLAGSWPSVPFPTFLPGGKGTYSQAFEIPSGQKGTFYYLELALEAKLGRKVATFKRQLENNMGRLVFVWRDVEQVRSHDDFLEWRENFTSAPIAPKNMNHKRTVDHVFRVPPPRPFKTKREMEDCDDARSSASATAGSSGASSISGVSSFSRPESRLSVKSSASDTGLISKRIRTWYNQDNWAIGGLRIKTEVKTESGIKEETFLN